MFNKELREARKSRKGIRKQLRNRAQRVDQRCQGWLPYIQGG
jgi:hypothetical protein